MNPRVSSEFRLGMYLKDQLNDPELEPIIRVINEPMRDAYALEEEGYCLCDNGLFRVMPVEDETRLVLMTPGCARHQVMTNVCVPKVCLSKSL